jgi:signal peptidase I
LVAIVVVALGLALGIQAVVVKPFRIPSESMVPTLEVGQRVLVDRASFRFGNPHLGDIVVFHPPAGADSDPNRCGAELPPDRSIPCPRPTLARSDRTFVKRVVAVGGDRVKVIDGAVYRNGRRQDEPYAHLDAGCPICDLPREIEVPEGQFFMMGDNRGRSDDSRVFGPVPKKWIIGKAFATYWPPRSVGGL